MFVDNILAAFAAKNLEGEMTQLVRGHRLGPNVDLIFPKPEDIVKPNPYTCISCSDYRYWTGEVAAYFSPTGELPYWMAYEIALANMVESAGICSAGATEAMVRACLQVTPELHGDLEAKGSHNVDALRKAINTFLPEIYWPATHFAATSYDAISSATSMQLRDFSAFLAQELVELVRQLGETALEWMQYPQIGRTHLQQAAPIVLGYWLAEYVDRLTYEISNLKQDAADLKGKYSGFVGVYGDQSLAFADPIAVERELLDLLCLKPARYSSQIVPYNQTNRLIQTWISICGTLSDLANDLRILLMQEVGELRRALRPGETGSSVGSHKVNPSNAELVSGLDRICIGYAAVSQLNMESNLQRDLRNSSGTRFIGDLADFTVVSSRRLGHFVAELEPNEERLMHNIYLTKGQIMAPAWNTLLRKYGHPKAHESTKALAERARNEGADLFDLASHEYGEYFDRMTVEERKLLGNPELYTGLAKTRTMMVVESCFAELGLLMPNLE